MSIYFRTFAEIKNEFYRSDFLMNSDIYLAHTHISKESEKFYDHNNLVVNYFLSIIKQYDLDKTIDHLISDLLGNECVAQLGEFVKFLFIDTIVYHDYGKVNENFQIEKMKNTNTFFRHQNNGIDSKHSILSAYIFLVNHFKLASEFNFTSEQKYFTSGLIFLFSYPVLKHHSPVLLDGKDDINIELDIQERLKRYLELFNEKDLGKFSHKPAYIDSGNKKLKDKNIDSLILRIQNKFSLFALLKLNYSLLTASDYLATNEYMNSLPISDFGILTPKRIDELHYNVSQREWIDEVQKKKNYNKETHDALEDYELLNPKEKSGDNLNVLRKEMGIEVIKSIRQHNQNNLFFIEAPTGGGKTNLSILAAVELLKIHKGQYNKVFYVFPYTTLITQTYTVVQDMLGLKEEEIIELHSKAGLKTSQHEDDTYGNEKLNYINHLFVNYPFCLLSHIRFFDILKTNEKETNYLLHRLANSIVVIDELQSYNPSHWDKVIYFIRQYAEKFNIKFILMSATLPKLDKLSVIKQNVQDFIYLLPNAKEQYFNNPNFAGRVNFNFELFERADLSLQELAEKVITASQDYLKYDFGSAKPQNSVYTIVEFIYKQSATDFYDIILEQDFFDEVFVLSGTILEHRRKEIINYLKNPSHRKKKIILITTQVVEAGVDIDMDLGFKDRSIIDSDEQLAGRINRNVNKENCTLYLFNFNKESVIYGKDHRYKITKEQIKPDEYKRILAQKDFDFLYNKVFEDRNQWNNLEMAENFKDYESAIQKLKFEKVHKEFQLIGQKNISCFIPLNIPITVESAVDGIKEQIFSSSELLFLKDNGVFSNERDEISGEKVFEIYLQSIRNKIDFTQQQIRKKVLQSIIGKYVFSIFASPHIESELIHFYDKEKSEFGYMYIQRYTDIYSIEQGLDAKKLTGIEETQFL